MRSKHEPDLGLVQAQVEDRVVELAPGRDRPCGRAGPHELLGLGGLRLRGSTYEERRDPLRPVDRERDVAVLDAVRASRRSSGGSSMPAASRGRSLVGGELARPLRDARLETRARHDLVDEPPLDRALAAHAFGGRREEVGVVATHPALVDDAREPAGSGQNAEQRDLRKRDRRRAVVDEQDLVAGERQLVAAAGGRPVQGAERRARCDSRQSSSR